MFAADVGRISADELRCEYKVNPLGVDARRPRFSWTLQSNRRGQSQSSYRILVANSKENLKPKAANKWDSGKVDSTRSVNVEYQGEALSSGKKCYWCVRVWDKDGAASSWSEPAEFEMGLLEPGDWQGQWVGAPGKKGTAHAPLLRKKFTLAGPVKRARLYAAGIGWSEYHLNGKRIGDNVLDPVATDYDKMILYVTHDVTALLQPGENSLCATLGNGWYSEPVRANYGDAPIMLLELVVELVDGSMRRISSGPDWRSAYGPILRNSLYGGEHYDARQEREGWLLPAYDDSSWSAAVVKPNPGGKLVSQILAPNKINRVLRPIKLTNPKPGVYIYDFGRLFGGWVRMNVKGPAGAKVAIRYSERIFTKVSMPDAEKMKSDVSKGYATAVEVRPGLVDKRRHHGSDGATDFYTLKGATDGEVYEPRFVLHPVRYVQLEGYPGEPTLDGLRGCVIFSSHEQSNSSFNCANPLLNKIYENCNRTVDNASYGITLDCLYREHWGWLEPASTPSTFFSRGFMPQFWLKYLRDIQNTQHKNGMIPDVVPAYPLKGRKTGDPAWAGNYPLVVWYVYQYYDDKRVLKENYPYMKRWVAYLTSRSRDNLLLDAGYYGDHMLPGDKPGDEIFISKETPPALIWSCFYYKNGRILAQAAELLGHKDDAEKYNKMAQATRSAINKKWLDPTGKFYATNSQTSNIVPLAFSVVPPRNRDAVLKSLTQNILEKRKGHLHMGNVGTTCAVDALPSLGQSDTFYRVLTSTDYPGWGYMVKRGATTVWESWGNVQDGYIGYNSGENSMLMFCSPLEFLYGSLAGLQGPSYFGSREFSPGFAEIRIRPYVPDGLDRADASFQSVHGIVRAGWRREAGRFVLQATVPVNAKAKIGIPKLGIKRPFIEEQGKKVWENGVYCPGVSGIVAAAEEEHCIALDVGSGNYRFVLREGADIETK